MLTLLLEEVISQVPHLWDYRAFDSLQLFETRRNLYLVNGKYISIEARAAHTSSFVEMQGE